MAQTISVTKKEPLKPNTFNNKSNSKNEKRPPLFRKTNYILMGVGLVALIIGYILLYAPGSPDPAVFDESIFDTRRLNVAPIFMVSGLIIEIFAIMWHPKQEKEESTAE